MSQFRNKLCDHIHRNAMGATERHLLQYSEGFLEEVLPEDKSDNQVKKGEGEDLADARIEIMTSCVNYFPNTWNFVLKLCNVTFLEGLVPQTPLISLSQIPNSRSTYANDPGAPHNFS